MSLVGYFSLDYLTPASLQDFHDGCSALIIGTGTSAKKLIPYIGVLKNTFDIIIGLNFATKHFEDIMDYHIVMEKNPKHLVDEMYKSGYKKTLPRVLNYKCIKMFPDDLLIYKARREHFFAKPSIKKYNFRHVEGLLEYRPPPEKKRKFYYGTVALQALHFACIVGCDKIYMAGIDLMFKDDYDHYYGDKFYREPVVTPMASRCPIIKYVRDGKTINTTYVFNKSAKCINAIIKSQCIPNNIYVYDFSNGLIKCAEKLDIDKFFIDKNIGAVK